MFVIIWLVGAVGGNVAGLRLIVQGDGADRQSPLDWRHLQPCEAVHPERGSDEILVALPAGGVSG